MKNIQVRGFTILEMMIVISIVGVLMGFAGFSMQVFERRYYVERQVRQLLADMMHARTRALEANKACFVTMSSNSYQITEDTNESGGISPDSGDMVLGQLTKQFRYQSQWTGTIIMDPKGIISVSTHPLLSNASFAIRFDTAGGSPDYDCISVGPTRMRAGKWNGNKCAPK
jgi:prepilin-type N-terminal cleavage/methylation domain-containing protein